jgi:hypothetical protein
MDKALQFPGVSNAWTMPIKARIDMLSTGIRTPVGVKVFGTDLGGSRPSMVVVIAWPPSALHGECALSARSPQRSAVDPLCRSASVGHRRGPCAHPDAAADSCR